MCLLFRTKDEVEMFNQLLLDAVDWAMFVLEYEHSFYLSSIKDKSGLQKAYCCWFTFWSSAGGCWYLLPEKLYH